MKSLKILFVLLLIALQGFSQNLKRLHVGDQVPNVFLKELLNYKKGAADLNEFMDKPLIIDMWFAECGSCIDAMPKLDSLQKEYKGKLNVLLSTFQRKEKAIKTFAEVRKLENLKFTQVVSDSTLLSLFPARLFPHQIWIDKNRTVVAITVGDSTNRKNVEKFIRGAKINFEEKIDNMDYLMAKGAEPLISYLYGRDRDKILNYSYLSRYRPDFSSGSGWEVDTASKTIRFNLRNMWFAELYAIAYTVSLPQNFNWHTDLIRNDTISLSNEPDFKSFSNIFCFDVICPNTDKAKISEYMVSQLDQAFNLKSRRAKRMLECYVIRPMGAGNSYLKPLRPDKRSEFQNKSLVANEKVTVNKFFPRILQETFQQYPIKPIYFENLLKGNLNFEFVWKPDDLKSMNEELKKFDLEISLEKRERDVIVLENR
jgi:thiol-disulfide isomerase/thioredoxin